LKFLDKFSNNTQKSDCIKIRSLEPQLFHEEGRADSQTDIKKLIVAFQKFSEVQNINCY